MDSKRANGNFSNREIISMIRNRLDEAGHADVTVSRLWIDEDTVGYPFLLHVPVGAELTVPLRPREDIAYANDAEAIGRHAGHFAAALINLKRAEKMLGKYARDVRRAAVSEIAAARAEGLDILLERVGFKPTYAYHLTHSSWKEAALHILGEVTVRHTSFYLRPETSVLWVEEPADVARELEDLKEEQRGRQDEVVELEARGFDLEVDAITLDLLNAHGLDAAAVLREVWKEQCVNLRVEDRGRETHLSLVSFSGKVTASFELENAYWNGEHLWFTGDEQAKDYKHLVGQPLGESVRHPVFASRRVVDVVHRHADHIVLDLSEKVLFDADTGRLFREEVLAA
ncbi:hypothetical protein SAMN05216382_2685 [Sphingomonas palmae]|uniref:Uncharacterized protein n=1 Tax=Sphingomonas palmae TaxID=1855283 RepID=A0A1H7T6Y2_9SPHN|nr:hypothetical protein [Sphingomonas palmae]SEL80488.1 hypothetical protein SAMN05216382_2685 [Sphingomonas palmae]